jgi:hypothetical protein
MAVATVILAGILYFGASFAAGFIRIPWAKRLVLFTLAILPALFVLLVLGIPGGCAFRIGGEECGAYGEAMAMAIWGLPVWVGIIAIALWLQRVVAARSQRSRP